MQKANKQYIPFQPVKMANREWPDKVIKPRMAGQSYYQSAGMVQRRFARRQPGTGYAHAAG